MLIIDIGLPGSKDGLQIIKELKSSAEYSHIPIITISVHTIKSTEAKDNGADVFLAKPFTRDRLMTAVSKFLE